MSSQLTAGQRINWFPDPNTTGTFPIVEFYTKVDYPVVNNRKWMRATPTTSESAHAEYALSDSQVPPAGSYHVHANAYAQKGAAAFVVNMRVDGSYSDVLRVPVSDGQTVVVDRTITIPSGCDRLGIRINFSGQQVGVIGMLSDILVERADTYDAAVAGGARRTPSCSLGILAQNIRDPNPSPRSRPAKVAIPR